jgi:hypothetical protein
LGPLLPDFAGCIMGMEHHGGDVAVPLQAVTAEGVARGGLDNGPVVLVAQDERTAPGGNGDVSLLHIDTSALASTRKTQEGGGAVAARCI